MRGAEIEVSLQYFLSHCGLEPGDIRLLNAYKDPSRSDVFVIMLYGEDERLPEIEDGKLFPKAQVVMTQSPDTCKITGKIVVNK